MQVGNWSRWLTDLFGMDVDDSARDQNTSGNNVHHADAELKCFHLLNALSDLLMLPKDMLIDRSVRTEVCFRNFCTSAQILGALISVFSSSGT